MTYETIANAWDDPNKKWPFRVYLEPTNHCNFHCEACPVDRHTNPKGIMSMEDFKTIAHKLKDKGLKLGSFFCFGESFVDPTLMEKMQYAHDLGIVVKGHIGMNTNVSLIKPEHYDTLMTCLPNITLSFFNVGEEFNKLTGMDKCSVNMWEKCYNIAIDMIKYRDQHHPSFEIFIGTNKVDGFNQTDVQEAFAGYRVRWAIDANIKYGKHEMLTGVIDRTIMYSWWRCDGQFGNMQIKWNGEVGYCAYDILHWDTNFGNILTDSWEELERKFREKWKSCSKLCAKCDFWHRSRAIINNECKRPPILTNSWYSWQVPFIPKGEPFIE